MGKEEINEYKAKLDDEILYLLRLKAMQMEIVNKNQTCYNHEKLYDYLMNNQSSIDAMEKDTPYFEKLMKEIGQTDDSTRDNPKYKVSVLTLKRLYGRIKSTSSASKKTLNYIAGFVSDSHYKWDELQERIEALVEELENDCIIVSSAPIRKDETVRPTHNGPIKKIYSVNLFQGDKLIITFDNGHRLELIYKGNNKYKVASTDSSVLKIGYTIVITRMRRLGHINEREVYDKDGNLTDGYASDIIKTIKFEGNPEVELRKFVQS